MVREHKPAATAYKEVYDTESDAVARTNASRLLTKANVQERKKEIEKSVEELFKSKSKRAFEVINEIMEDSHTPTAERRKAATDILNYGGYSPTQKVEQSTTTTIKDMTQDKELMKKALKSKLDQLED